VLNAFDMEEYGMEYGKPDHYSEIYFRLWGNEK
jgi:hypothetical protein